MTTPYIGEIRMFGGNFAPVGWLLCNGNSLPINEFAPLFNLIGTTYGGDGVTSFNLPNLQSRVPVHVSSTMPLGSVGGTEQVTLSTTQIPSHNHAFVAGPSGANTNVPTGNILTGGSPELYRGNALPSVHMSAAAIGPAGNTLPHTNIQPYLCVNFIIATEGVYPPRT